MVMVGRHGERARLTALVRATDGRALVLRGETGIGKSSLLDLAAQLATRNGHLVVRATGVEAETELPYAGLHQLLYPLLPDAGQPGGSRLGATARETFDSAFDRTGGPPPSVMALGIAVLNLLSSTASERPLLLVLDDGQWLDDASADICGFVGRRLAGTPGVKLLVAVRDGTSSRFDTAALPEAQIGALADADAARLLDRQHPGLDGQLRALVLDHARGNPLALLELPVQAASRVGVAVALRPGTEALNGASAGGLAGVPVMVPVSATDGPSPTERCRVAGLPTVEPAAGGLALRPPLLRPSTVRTAVADQLPTAQRVLAPILREVPEQRTPHPAAVIDPDEDVAAALEAAARSAARRGGALAAVSWLPGAAEASEDRAGRPERAGWPADTGWAGQAHSERSHATWAGTDRAQAPHAPEPVAVPLTWQERRVAELAAAGLTNKEIGERIQLSPRTVSTHLYRAFPKLGVTTRAALRDALTRMDDRSAKP
uniref:helix-turn-helix transcriptional regulator n=1 Tax=Kitasatospora xanthocidica TaxID=83382 RepID=UPI001E38FEC1|nr:LuxR family transcriptional regulator [Kitasatospora xanthocidica]